MIPETGTFRRTTAIRGVRLSVGGVEDFNSILRLSGHVRSHDFVGCMHSLRVNGRDILNIGAAVNYTSLSDTCPRQRASGLCGPDTCGGGECRDHWSHVECRCGENSSGRRCETSKSVFVY